jgi:DNA-binding transcriptional ArsR family regulator
MRGGAVSIDLVAAALWLPMDPARKLVLIALCERARLDTGECFPGREEIAARASLSTRRVTPHLQALKKQGYVRREVKGSARRGLTTTRYLDVDRILSEGKLSRDAFRARQKSQDDSSPDDPDQGTLLHLLGDDRDIIRGRASSPPPSDTTVI